MYSRVVIFLLLMFLIAGYTESHSQLRADPDACPQYKCKTVHAYWNGIQKTTVTAFFIGDANADHGIESLFTTNSVETLPRAQPGTPPTNLDIWFYPQCTPFCGKDGAGNWQAAQEVLKSGDPTECPDKVSRRPCAANGGNPGPQVTPAVNANTKGYTPPGYTPGPGGE